MNIFLSVFPLKNFESLLFLRLDHQAADTEDTIFLKKIPRIRIPQIAPIPR